MKYNCPQSTVGVYAISGSLSCSVYIGGTTHLDVRFDNQHVPLLEKNKHSNFRLQLDWNEYGPKSFSYIILEETTIDNLKEREKEYIKEFKEKGIAYNLKDGASGPLFMSEETKTKMSEAKSGANHPNFGKPRYEGSGRQPKQYKFLSPDGQIIETVGLKGLCQEHGLNISHLSKLANRKIKQYKGWKVA